jgi:hypothetical protein
VIWRGEKGEWRGEGGLLIGTVRGRNGRSLIGNLIGGGELLDSVSGEINARKKKLTRSDCWGPHVSEGKR